MSKTSVVYKRPRKYARKKSRWLSRQAKLNIPRGPSSYGNLLMKSQYCDFAMSALLTPVAGVTGSGQVTYGFSRMDWNSNVPLSLQFGINEPPLWARASRLFEEYAVKGFRLEYIPTNVMGQVEDQAQIASGIVQAVQLYQDVNTYNISGWTQTQIVQSNGYTIVDPKKTYTLYVDNAKLARQEKTSWKNTGASTVTSNGNPQAGVAIRIGYGGCKNGQVLAQLKATWYITMRGIKAG